MCALKGDNLDPGMLDDSIGQQDRINEEQRRKHQEAIENEFEKWRAFQETPHGRVCADLALPKIRHLEAMLGTSTHNLVHQYGLPLDCIQDIRAEWRGERKVWYQILAESERLKKELENLGEGEEKKKAGWVPMPSWMKK